MSGKCDYITSMLFPSLQRVGEPVHRLVEALAAHGRSLEYLEGPIAQGVQAQRLVHLCHGQAARHVLFVS